MRTLIVTVLVLAVCAPMALARTWTDSTGKHTVEAEFIDMKDGKVRLKKEDGKTITIPIEKLSDEDQQFVKSLTDEASPSKKATSKPKPGASAPSKKNVRRKPDNLPGQDLDGAFDKLAFDTATKNASDARATAHAMKLGVAQDNLQAFFFLVHCGTFFIKDNAGHFIRDAGKEAFTAAVLNITPTMMATARQLTRGTDGDSERGAIFILLSGSGPFVEKTAKFSASNFNAAFHNLDKAKVDKAAKLLDAGSDFALTALLRASGEFLDSKGVFDASHFNSRLDAQETAQFAGDKDDRLRTFFKVMKPVGRARKTDKPIASGEQRDETLHAKDNSAEPTYFDVRADINKYVGRRVAWVAHQVTCSHSTDLKTREDTTTYVFLARDAKGRFLADYPFLFSHAGDYTRTKRTSSAIKADNTPNDKGVRIIRGTVKGAAEFKDMEGNASHVPELRDVTVDAP